VKGRRGKGKRGGEKLRNGEGEARGRGVVRMEWGKG